MAIQLIQRFNTSPLPVGVISSMAMRVAFVLLATLIAVTTLTMFSPSAYAQNEGRWYQVELLIFKRNPATINTNEIWRNDIELSYPSNTHYIASTLDKSTHELGGHNYTLRRDESFTVLFHQSWQQQMWGKEESPALVIRGGQSFGVHKELEGTIKIHIGRYLHLSTDLWLSQFQYPTGTNVEQYSEWPLLPSLPSANTEAYKQQYQYLFNDGPRPVSIITFREKRRMRSKETHYIDHPHMGILVRMLPLKIPNS